MSGRGRGGRGGRGGNTKSFNREQLNALGVGGNEVLPGPVTQPPPLYPLLDRRPVPINPSLEMDYLLILRQDFIDHMQLSGSYIKLPKNKNNQPEQEIDKLVAQLPTVKEKYDWALFPSELRPKMLAKRIKKKVVKEVNVEQRLTLLEKLEEKSENAEVPANNVGDDEVEEIEEIDEDEEMDDGTDYANNYFDNGEAYEDEDDNLEDGPIY
ncbi:DNA-directed RNA polymerase III subunit RPC7-like [Anoplophora glabripennis]|uniref:DNA-directed RNA polymerase III subunit RPC7-like n=1 Tax=Anoplophora glabripennis TaxID=217634 RepID=UPI00087504FE|nr:DNA-directed RNA polymerase III subunit RPC7-like [Anoplophora glabripennis]